jgi:glycosyltransferase involved in cell wall biosynthesis
MRGWRCGVVVSARDEANMIGERLKSLWDQIANLFLVVVDDGSVDGTDEVASKHADIVVINRMERESIA